MLASEQKQGPPEALTLVDEARDGIVVVGPDGTIGVANPAVGDLVRLEPREIVGRPFEEFFSTEIRHKVVRCLERSRAGEEILVVLPIQSPSTERQYVEIRARSLEDGRVMAVLRDIGALRRHEHTLQVISGALAEATATDFFESLVLGLVDALPIDFAFVGELLEPERSKIGLQAFAGTDGLLKAVEYELADTPCQVVLTERRRFFTDDAPRDFPRDQILIDLGIRSYYALPLLDGPGEPVGILGILNRESVQLDSMVAVLLDLVAARASSEIQRIRAEHQSGRAQRLMRALMQASSRFIWGVDADGEPILDSMGAWNEATGFGEGELGPSDWISAVVPEDRPKVWAEWQSAFAERRDLDMTYRVAGPEGMRHLHVRGMPMHDEAGAFEGFIGTIDDVTGLKRSAEDLRRRNDVLRILRAVPEATHNGAGFLESVQVALAEVCRTSPFHAGRLLMRSTEDGPFRETGLVCGERKPGDPAYDRLGSSSFLEGDPELRGQVETAGSPLWMHIRCPEVKSSLSADSHAFPEAAEAEVEAAAGWTAGFVTVRLDDDPVAILELTAPRCVEPDEIWTEVLAQLGIQLGRAYERDRNQILMREAERKARESQKLEAVGRLSGGIAHDFNNLLMVILGEAELALRSEGVSGTLRVALEEIRSSGQRAASLTSQLLAFSRRQIQSPETLDLAELVGGTQRMLRRLLGEDIELDAASAVDAESCWVEITRGLMEQVLMNLVVNAREAMPTGGRIRVGLGRREVGAEKAAAILTADPGDFVVLSVSDTGVGIPEEIRESIFEPFFTTKEDGTGFGLSTSYGIVSSAGGFIEVDSEVGKGTEFRIFLPLVDGPVDAESLEGSTRAAGPDGRSVLVVEDDDGVRSVAIRILESAGYLVHAARDGEEVRAYLADDNEAPDVLLTDCVLERETGREIDALVRERHPHVGTVFMSGYTDDVLLRQGVNAEGREFLPKPFSPDALIEAVERVRSDGRRRASSESDGHDGSGPSLAHR